jgi:diguanylate cyclase (GGDEF)-like protein
MVNGIGAPLKQFQRLSSKHLRLWTCIAAGIVILGSASAFVGANAIVRSSNERSHKAFITSSFQIASTLKLDLQHEQDLIDSTQSFLIGNPAATQAQFLKWTNELHILNRYPELQNLGVIDYLTKAQLGAYARRVSPNQPSTFKVEPSGVRAHYCLAPLGISRTASTELPKNTDVCASQIGPLFVKARDSGKSQVLPFAYQGLQTIGIEIPVYRGNVVPTTTAGRERAFVEVVALNMVPNVLMTSARDAHPNTAVALLYGGANSKVQFRSGRIPRDAQTTNVNVHDGWTVEVLASNYDAGLLANRDAMSVLFSGVTLSLLLGALILLLSTGRTRLKVLVGERTEEIQFQAMHDSLTGLPNRALIVDRIEQLLERNRRGGTLGAALFVDLDDFKNVNDTLGHETGDRLLVQVAARMQSTLREADTIGRMGGDEFVVLVDGGEMMIAPELVARRLLSVMRQPFEIEGVPTPLVVSTSIGIAVGDHVSGSDLLRDADVALYQAKADGKNRYVFFQSEMQNDISRRLALEFDLRSALSEGQFYLVYQPIYKLDDLTIVGAEALLRWRHPSQGVLQPDEFIPILERTGLIREVGAWVLRESCRQIAAWRDIGDNVDVSVNVSGRQLDSDLIIEQIQEALDESGLRASNLIIEITETALMLDVDSAVTRLQTIKDLGVRIAIDDFGTGYSSLSHLCQFPVDCIKIDKSFISAIMSSEESRALVKTFIQLGEDLGMRTLAEGVETLDQLDLLRDSHVTEVQGFLFSRPLEPGLFESQILLPFRKTGTPIPRMKT